MPRLALIGNDVVVFLDYKQQLPPDKQVWRYFNSCGEHQNESECYRCEKLFLECNHSGDSECNYCGYRLRISGSFSYSTRLDAYHSWNPCLFFDRDTDEKVITILKECGYMPRGLYRCLCCGGINYVDNECRYTNNSPHDPETKTRIYNFLRNSGWNNGESIPKDLHKAAIYSVLKGGYNELGPQATRPEVKELMKIIETPDYVPDEKVDGPLKGYK